MTLPPLPADRPVLAFYGDDFTGSGAVMEVLTFAGLPTVLFLEPPTPERARPLPRRPRRRPRRRRPHPQPALDARRAAGDLRRPARPRRPDPALQDLLDPRQRARTSARSAPPPRSASPTAASPRSSSPPRGSAAGRPSARSSPAPATASTGSTATRRWRVHPVTPMDEADVCRHLARQTSLGLGLDRPRRPQGRPRPGPPRRGARARRRASSPSTWSTTRPSPPPARLIWHGAPGFVIGSQGVEYALVAAWRAAGLLPPPRRRAAPRRRSSGSPSSPAPARRSPPTQIDARRGRRLRGHRPRPRATPTGTAAADRGARRASRDGRSPLVATARGASDPGVADGAALGTGLGRLLDRLRPRGRPHPRRHRRRRHLEPRRPRPRPRRADRRDAGRPRRGAAPRPPRRRHARSRSRSRAARWVRPTSSSVCGRPGNRRRNSRRMRRNGMTKIALMGAGGKMGVRLATNLMGSRFDIAPVEVAEAGRARLKAATGLDCIEQGQALSRADVVLLAVPDRADRRGRAPDRPAARPRHRRHRARRRRPARRRDARARRRHLLRHPPLPPADLQRRDRPGGEGRLLRRRRAPSSTSSAR